MEKNYDNDPKLEAWSFFWWSYIVREDVHPKWAVHIIKYIHVYNVDTSDQLSRILPLLSKHDVFTYAGGAEENFRA